MPKPFPFPVTIGTDICHVKRIFDILTKGYSVATGLPPSGHIKDTTFRGKARGRRFVKWVLTREEIEDGVQRGKLHMRILEEGMEQGNTTEREHMSAMARFLGGRWAAKEAIIKAHPSLPLKFHDITVIPSTALGTGKSEAPIAVISARQKDIEMDPGEAQEVPLSISHDGEYATAVALGFYKDSFVAERFLGATNSNGGSTSEARGYGPSFTPNYVYIQPLREPPAKIGEKPQLGLYPVWVTNLNARVEHKFLLDLFKLRYPTVRCVAIEPHLHIVDKVAYADATVCFGFRAEAERAVEEMNGFDFLGQKMSVTHPKSKNRRTPLIQTRYLYWLWNEEHEKSIKPDENSSTQVNISESNKNYDPSRLKTQRLSPIKNVFQDNPLVLDWKEKQKIRDSYGTFWSSEEIIQTSRWDSIEGGHIYQMELDDVQQRNELKEEMKANFRRQIKEGSTEQKLITNGNSKNLKFQSPRTRRGFLVHP